MGRKKRQPTVMVRISLPDKRVIQELAKRNKISIGEYISRMTRRKR